MGGRSRAAVFVGPLVVALTLLLPGRSGAIPLPGPGPGPGNPGGEASTILTLEPVVGTYGETVTVVAQLRDADTDAGVPGQVVNFLFHGDFLSATTDATGRAVLESVPLERSGVGRVAAGWYPGDVEATFDGVSGSFSRSTGAADLIVDQRVLKVIPDSFSREYGDPNPAVFSYRLENFLAGDGPELLTSSPVCTTAASAASGAGTYEITCDGLAAENYTADYSTPGTLTVTPAPMVIKADDYARLYGQATPTLTASYVGTWKLSDGPGSLKGTLKCSSQNGGIKWAAVGAYEIICAGQSAANYALKYVPGTLQVAPAPLLAEVGAYFRMYGQPDPAFMATGFTGFVNGETSALVKGSLQCAAPGGAKAPVGTYTLDCTGLTAPNYTMVYHGELSVTRAPLTVAAGNAVRLYGAPDPALTFALEGLLPGDDAAALAAQPVCTAEVTGSSPVGTYDITCSSGSAANYALSYRAGTLTVLPVPLTVTAEDKVRRSGEPNPAFTARYTGFVGGEGPGVLTGTLSCTTPAVSGSQPGTYPITCGGLGARNYTLNYVDGALLVNRRPRRPVDDSPPAPPVPAAPAPAPAPASVVAPAPVTPPAPASAAQAPHLVSIQSPFGSGAGKFRVYVEREGHMLRITVNTVGWINLRGDRVTLIGLALVEDVTDAAHPAVLEQNAALSLAWAPGKATLSVAGTQLHLELK